MPETKKGFRDVTCVEPVGSMSRGPVIAAEQSEGQRYKVNVSDIPAELGMRKADEQVHSHGEEDSAFSRMDVKSFGSSVEFESLHDSHDFEEQAFLKR